MWGNRKCPTCKADTHIVDRIKRSFLVRLIPTSKVYRCKACKSKFLLIGSKIIWSKIGKDAARLKVEQQAAEYAQ